MRSNSGRRLVQGRTVVAGAMMAAVLGHAAVLLAQPAEAAPPATAIKNVIPYLAEPLPLSAVRLTGGPLKAAQDADAKYLLSLDPDRALFFLRVHAGLKPRTPSYSGGPAVTQGYVGWDAGVDRNGQPDRQLTGHIAGHYLSAISYMYAATGNPEFKKRVDYMVAELKDIQNANGDGYIGALNGNAGGGGRGAGGGATAPKVEGKTLFAQLAQGTIRSTGFDLNGMWSPWYVQHKIFAGLRDAYRLTGNKDALAVEVKLGGWADGILSKLTPAQIQNMLRTEFGGMNEVMADLYADTGDPKWLKACDYFQHHAMIDPMAQKRDDLANAHGNTQVPKFLGELERYIFTGQELSGNSSKFFWDDVVNHYTFATGGHGYDESFGVADKMSGLVDGSARQNKDLRTCESCNVYNMLKFTRKLFAIEPDDKYSEFLERGLYNHVLGSIDPATGQTCYMVPIGQNVTHEYQTMQGGQADFTCCVGTGMESHALHGDGIFYESGSKLWVTLFAPVTAQWQAQGALLAMDTNFPLGETASIKMTLTAPKELTVAVRRPAWAGDRFAVAVNGQAVAGLPKPGNFVEIKRTWNSGDTISLVLPKELHTEATPDNPNRVALLWGPIVLAGDMGRGGRGGRAQGGQPFESFVNDQPVDKWLEPGTQPGTFHAKYVLPTGDGTQTDVNLVPFYQLAQHKYTTYWDVFTSAQWQKQGHELTAEQIAGQKLTEHTVGYAQPGQMQAERDCNFQGEESSPVQVRNQDGRKTSKWMSFDMPVDAAKANVLMVTYDSDEAATRTFDLLVDGKSLGSQVVEKSSPSRFYDVEYKLADDMVQGKQKVTVKFQPSAGSQTPGVFGLRVVRGD